MTVKESFLLTRQGDMVVLSSPEGRQIILKDYGDEIGVWCKLLKEEIRVSKLKFIQCLFNNLPL